MVRAEAVPALGRLTAVRAAIPRLVRLSVRVGVERGRRGLGAVARVGGAGCEAGAGVVLGRGAGVAPDAVGDDAVGGGDDEEGEEEHHQQEDDDVGLKQIRLRKNPKDEMVTGMAMFNSFSINLN